jgi:hypothetical protein
MNKKLEQKIQALEAEVKRLELKLVARNTAFLSIVGKSLDGILIIAPPINRQTHIPRISHRLIQQCDYIATNNLFQNKTYARL